MLYRALGDSPRFVRVLGLNVSFTPPAFRPAPRNVCATGWHPGTSAEARPHLVQRFRNWAADIRAAARLNLSTTPALDAPTKRASNLKRVGALKANAAKRRKP